MLFYNSIFLILNKYYVKYAMLCYVMLCYVMLRYVTLRYVMLCHSNSFNSYILAELSRNKTGGVQVKTEIEKFTVMCSRSL